VSLVVTANHRPADDTSLPADPQTCWPISPHAARGDSATPHIEDNVGDLQIRPITAKADGRASNSDSNPATIAGWVHMMHNMPVASDGTSCWATHMVAVRVNVDIQPYNFGTLVLLLYTASFIYHHMSICKARANILSTCPGGVFAQRIHGDNVVRIICRAIIFGTVLTIIQAMPLAHAQDGGKICNFGLGDGVGGTEEQVGDATTSAECAALVQSTRPEANGATYPTNEGTATCYAEFGMTGTNDPHSGWQTCMFEEAQAGACPRAGVRVCVLACVVRVDTR
jgi:hypothetical protein